MADTLRSNSPIIPVIDERLACLPSAPSEHKAKIAEYNELLEVIYQREVELSGIKHTLADMRELIAQEARLFEPTTDVVVPQEVIAKSDSESDIDAEHVLSDTNSDKAKAPVRKTAKKDKKPKGSRRSKVPDAQLEGDWDYKLDLASRGAARGRRQSDASDDSEPALI